jgi:hypothetical protein
MLQFEAWCRPHGRPAEAARFAFVLEAIDTRAARQMAMKRCFYGTEVTLKDGGEMRLEPLAWTVCRVKALEEVPAVPTERREDDWPRPQPELAAAATHDTALARLYSGQRYQDYRIRPSRSVLDFCHGTRVVSFGARAGGGSPMTSDGRAVDRRPLGPSALPGGASRPRSRVLCD